MSTDVNVTGPAADGLRLAAAAWTAAWLSGTPQEVADLAGPECLTTRTTGSDQAAAIAAMQRIRDAVKRRIGNRPIGVVGVRLRHVTATRGEAEVQYGLPESLVGNDNWVGYELISGKWKVADCRLPICGSSEPKTG